MKIFCIIGQILIFIIFCISNIYAQKSIDSTTDAIDSFITEYLEWYNIPGLSIGVIQDNKVIFSKGYGVKDVGSGQKVTPQTSFSLASITKLFVGTAVMQLVEKRLIDLQDPVIKYLPYFKLKDDRYKKITIIQMLSHTSGLPDIERAEFDSAWQNPEYDEGALERYVRSIQGDSLIAEPGELYLYSNLAYDVLGDLISKVSGMSFEEYIQTKILIPLEMNNSTILYEDVDKRGLALPHLMNEKLEYEVSEMMPYSRRHPACGTLFSNVLDMSNWAIANINEGVFKGNNILQKSSYDIMWKPAVLADNPVGISWLVEDLGPYKLFSHGGGDPGYISELYIIPEKSIGVIVLANCWEDEVNPIAIKVLNILLGENEKDWFTYFKGNIWKSVREQKIEETIILTGNLIKKNGMDDFHPAILNQLGNRLVDLNRFSEASALFKLNTELYPKIFQLYNSLARAYIRMEEFDLAIATYKKSLEVKPENPEAVEMLKKLISESDH